jgi:MATE family multidrug resistance protein
VMSLIDLAMVGKLGNRAIGAAGLASFSYALVVAFVGGIAPAVQGLVARRRGEGSAEARCLPLNGGLVLALVVGTPLTILCVWLTPFFFSLLSSDPQVTAIGIPFLRILYLSIIASGIHRAFQGHWAGMEKPKVYMAIVLFMVGLNVLLNYILIFGHFGAPALGATGAAIGTVLSLHAGILVNFAITYFRFREDGFLKVKPEAPLLKRIFKMGMPPTLQQFFFSAGYVVYLWLLGKVGTAELAAGNVLVRISLVLLILATALGIASATLVSRTLGEGDPAGAAQWGWDSGKLGVIAITLLGLPLFLFPRLFLAIFLTDRRHPHAAGRRDRGNGQSDLCLCLHSIQRRRRQASDDDLAEHTMDVLPAGGVVRGPLFTLRPLAHLAGSSRLRRARHGVDHRDLGRRPMAEDQNLIRDLGGSLWTNSSATRNSMPSS